MKLTWSPRKLDYQTETNWKKLFSDSTVAVVAYSETEYYPLILDFETWETEIVFWSSKYIFGNIMVPTIDGQNIVIDKWNQKTKETRQYFVIEFGYDKAVSKFSYSLEVANKITQHQANKFTRNYKIIEKKILEREKFLRDAKKERPFND